MQTLTLRNKEFDMCHLAITFLPCELESIILLKFTFNFLHGFSLQLKGIVSCNLICYIFEQLQ